MEDVLQSLRARIASNLELLQSSVALLKGKIHEGLDNRTVAAQNYREALLLDCTCYEAFEKLAHFQSITASEGAALLADLDFSEQLDPKMAKLSQYLYEDKLSQLDKRFGPTWLALGHAFASDGEHDQAIAAYCTAAQVIRGSHIPIMYIGIEYSASNNRNLAERFLRQAYNLDQSDPFILHELGTLAFQMQKYADAIQLFTKAYDRACELSGQMPSPFWEPLVNNMAHTYRKLGTYDRAIEMHQLSLRLCPNSSTTLAGLALVYAMTGRVREAVDQLNRALRIPLTGTGASAFATTMFSVCVDLLTTGTAGGPKGKPSSGQEERHSAPGQGIPDSPPQTHLPPARAGSLPGAEKIRFKKRSPDPLSTKCSTNALQLDVVRHPAAQATTMTTHVGHPLETPSRSLDTTSDEDVTMELE